ncbi:MAG: YicC family protein [Gammaproteobacteria bacterium]|nr:YicC family protein [Gammaproteobacteria bacterium]
MLASMTAFARAETTIWVWEVRSVNHRFLDLNFNMPSSAQALEADLRTHAKNVLNRGRIEASLSGRAASSEAAPTIDAQKLRSLLVNARYSQMVMGEFTGSEDASNEPIQQLDVLDVMRWPGVLKDQADISPDMHDDICESFAEALESLITSRKVEGESLSSLLQVRLASIQKILAQLEAMAGTQTEYIREKLHQRLEKFGVNLEPNRIAQEVALLAQRADVHEEIDRLNVQISEFESCMLRDEPQGRRLGFIVQEMARESNTLAAKLAPPDAVNLTVDLKVLVDQLREQVQNVE